MRISKSAGAIAVLASACMMLTPVPGGAAVLGGTPQGLAAASKQLSPIVNVQLPAPTPPSGGPAGAPPRPAPAQQNRRERHGGGGGGAGAAAAAGIIGLGIGAILATESQRQHPRAVEECARRYPSYDPESETFIGRNGIEYQCP